MTRRLSRWWLLLLLIPLAAGLARLRFDVEVLNLLPSDLPVVEGLKLYQRHFANANELILTVKSDDAEAAESAARQIASGLRGQTNLVSRVLWQPPWREHPEHMAELLACIWLNQPPDAFTQLAGRLGPDRIAATLATTRNALATSLSPDTMARLAYDPLGLADLPEAVASQAGGFGRNEDQFASADGTLRLLFVKSAAPLGSYRDCDAWLERLQQSVENIQRDAGVPSDVSVGYTGAPAFVAEIASGMERDMSGSATGTLLVVAALFWWAHRRLLPLAWLTALLLVVLAAALALGGLFYGQLNVISLGFAAILIGLTDDYPAVLYQEALDHPHLGSAEIRRRCGPAIAWSAVTTAGAFLLLNFAALPGLAQLGTLISLGVLLAAWVMLYAFLPVALKRRSTHGKLPAALSTTEASSQPVRFSGRLAWIATFTLLGVTVFTLWLAPPVIDHSAEALNPTGSAAQAAMKDIETHFTGTADPLLVLVSGRDEAEVGARMEALEARMRSPGIQARLGKVTFPSALWPQPVRQQTNLALAAGLCAQRSALRTAVLGAGFNDDAFQLTDAVLQIWERARTTNGAVWPGSESNRWLLDKIAARTEDGWLALAMVQPATNSPAGFSSVLASLDGTLVENGAWLTGWSALGEAMLAHTVKRLPWLVSGMLLLVGVCLWLAFRNLREVLLSFAALGTAFLALLTLMSLLGWSWNLMNLVAAPLLLGAGVDYAIHTQLTLRRNGGDPAAFRRTTGRALLLAAATTIAGFGSLAWAGNAGLASLGRLCAVGLGCVLLVSVGLLPAWWNAIARDRSGAVKPSQPSSFYRREIWALGLWLGRILPGSFCNLLARALGLTYWRLNPERREVVIQNLLPACDGNQAVAKRATRRLFQEFAVKVADLWRFESGAMVDRELCSWSGWETFEAARARGQGVLLITPHLGNWEFGGPFLAKRGIKLVVLTQAEPGNGFTELRQQARLRWGIETIVVGESPFAFIEIIKRLQAGATIALLVDRPPPPTGVAVELFGRPFIASIAAAELARATGCALLPVYVLREPGGYAAHVLTEVAYDRATIGNRAARVQLTQEILRAFEPVIRQHVTQWYHFVPIWPH